MNKRLLTILLLAFVIAGACAFLVYKAIGNRLGAARPMATTRVVAAASDIKLGTVLTASNLTTVDIAGEAPKGAILDKDKNSLEGRGVISDLYQGEPILDSRLAPVGSGGGLAATIPQGMRAIAVKVDEVVGVAGFVTPRSHVDVLGSGTPPGVNYAPGSKEAMEGTLVKTILQNIEVLSAGISIQKDPEGKPQQVQVVNLLVTPEQAETLTLAGNGVKIQLVLRNPLDTKTETVPMTAMGNIFTDVTAAPAKKVVARAVKKAAPAPAPFSIEVINGSKRTEEKFGSPEAKQ
ncbi:MAG TPA: Flp pilus assembly protein CpaB [Terracidiphilus sp.]|nr:Flp pilus assembly protein CpaB [Terracidiphilus sp.]